MAKSTHTTLSPHSGLPDETRRMLEEHRAKVGPLVDWREEALGQMADFETDAAFDTLKEVLEEV